jgi:hypothetical protein
VQSGAFLSDFQKIANISILVTEKIVENELDYVNNNIVAVTLLT